MSDILEYKIGVVCSGLGHVVRGNEMLAENIAYMLRENGVNVRLYKGGGREKSDIESVVSEWMGPGRAATFFKKGTRHPTNDMALEEVARNVELGRPDKNQPPRPLWADSKREFALIFNEVLKREIDIAAGIFFSGKVVK